MASEMVHQRALSFKKLRVMKINNRRSISVIALHEHLGSASTIAEHQYLGQFGQIVSARVLENRQPIQLFVVFVEESSAIQALAWCNQQPLLFSEAKHGYQKYCPKFINHQKCRKPTCRGRHSWSDAKDILYLKKGHCINRVFVRIYAWSDVYPLFVFIQLLPPKWAQSPRNWRV